MSTMPREQLQEIVSTLRVGDEVTADYGDGGAT